MQHGERFNTITHLIGAAFASIGAALLLHLAISKNDMVEIISFTIYAISTVGLYTASTLYHGSQGDIKNLMRRLDYIGIYLKIAGNYTPFLVLLMRGSVGWLVLTGLWILAAVGIILEFNLGKKTRRYSMIIYGIMSLAVLPVAKHLIDALPPAGFALIAAGFVSYALGFYFYLNDERIKHGHGLWHLGVIGGSTLQYLCLLMYVA
jgi:hemolysin III